MQSSACVQKQAAKHTCEMYFYAHLAWALGLDTAGPWCCGKWQPGS